MYGASSPNPSNDHAQAHAQAHAEFPASQIIPCHAMTRINPRKKELSTPGMPHDVKMKERME
jgi:hypothetical protein